MRGGNAREIAGSIEDGVRAGRLVPGAPLPTVRGLARALRVSPATVAAAYRTLAHRGVLVAHGRRGTRVGHRPPVFAPPPAPVPAHLRNLADGNPDPALLPKLRGTAHLTGPAHLYGQGPHLPDLLRHAAHDFVADGIPADAVAVVSGAMDGIERVLQAHLRPGDRVLVEDPGYPAVFDLLGALGLVAEPVAVDESGLRPDDLTAALAQPVSALVLTPRAQNPTGAALDEPRARILRRLLGGRPEVLVIEDDHAAWIAGTPAVTLCAGRERWAVIRSVSKSLGPDLRVTLIAGDPTTIARVEGRQWLGPGWVSHILQRLVAGLLSKPQTAAQLASARAAYTERRAGLIDALAAHGIPAYGRSGLNVWIPVADEDRTLALLAEAGWALRGGERYRLKSPPAVRASIATLRPPEARRLAADLARALGSTRRTYSA